MKDKIKALFEYRLIPELLKNCENNDQAKLMSDLQDLQMAIYELDRYLETNWRVDSEQLSNYWDGIYRVLMKMQYDLDSAKAMCSEIEVYQSHELLLRKAKWPHQLDLKKYYYYKSCDVRLMRRIILEKCPELNKQVLLEDWKFFDFITELNDDIEDVIEDQKSINGNAFLISYALEGADYSRNVFSQLIISCLNAQNHYVKQNIPASDWQLRIQSLSHKYAEDCRELMEHQISALNDLDNSEIQLFNELKIM